MKNNQSFLYILCLGYLSLMIISCGSDDSDNDNDGGNNVCQLTGEDVTFTIDENPSSLDFIGQLVSNGSDDVSLNFDVDDLTGVSFNSANGELIVNNPTLFDHETATQITGSYIVTADNCISSDRHDITININDVDENSCTLSPTPRRLEVTMAENPVMGQVIGTIFTTSPNGQTVSYAWDNDIPGVAINQNGQITVSDPSFFDYETNTFIENTVIVFASGCGQASVSVRINITDVAESSNVFGDWSTILSFQNTNFSNAFLGIQAIVNTGEPFCEGAGEISSTNNSKLVVSGINENISYDDLKTAVDNGTNTSVSLNRGREISRDGINAPCSIVGYLNTDTTSFGVFRGGQYYLIRITENTYQDEVCRTGSCISMNHSISYQYKSLEQ